MKERQQLNITGVGSDMIGERGGSGEGASAEAAFEGTIGGMRHHVIPQLVRRRKHETTVSALIWVRRRLVA